MNKYIYIYIFIFFKIYDFCLSLSLLFAFVFLSLLSPFIRLSLTLSFAFMCVDDLMLQDAAEILASVCRAVVACTANARREVGLESRQRLAEFQKIQIHDWESNCARLR